MLTPNEAPGPSDPFLLFDPMKSQVSSYAERKGMDLETCEKWLSPILNYERD